jgi:hypothetical protein
MTSPVHHSPSKKGAKAESERQRLHYALQTLQDARGELTSEARWLRHEFSPRRMAHRAVDRHATGLLASAFGVGLVIAWMIFRKASSQPKRIVVHEASAQPKSRGGIAGTIVKAAIPFVLKFATSPRFIESILNRSQAAKVHRARATV